MHYDGLGVTVDYIQAREWYLKAAEQGYAKAQYCLGVIFDAGQGVRQDSLKAARWYRKAGTALA